MATITGGVVFVEDGTKSDQEYSPARKVRVELRFDIPDEAALPGNLGSAIAFVGDVASAEVARLLGRTPAADTTRVVRVIEPGQPGSITPQVETPKRTRRTKEQIAADEAAAKGSTDPLAGVEEKAPAADSVSGDDLLGDLLGGGGEPEPEVTDAELNAAVQEKAKTFKDVPSLRKLIQETFGAKTLADVPQERRGDFLKQLAALA